MEWCGPFLGVLLTLVSQSSVDKSVTVSGQGQTNRSFSKAKIKKEKGPFTQEKPLQESLQNKQKERAVAGRSPPYSVQHHNEDGAYSDYELLRPNLTNIFHRSFALLSLNHGGPSTV